MSDEIRLRVERSLATKSGQKRLVVWSSVLLRDRNGQATGTLSIGADITERRAAENAREAALAEIEALTRRLEDEVVYLKSEIRTTGRFDSIVGDSDALKYVLQKVDEVAPLDTTVLIEGETGVGKELFARAIHEHSSRKDRPLVKVNCATLGDTDQRRRRSAPISFADRRVRRLRDDRARKPESDRRQRRGHVSVRVRARGAQKRSQNGKGPRHEPVQVRHGGLDRRS